MGGELHQKGSWSFALEESRVGPLRGHPCILTVVRRRCRRRQEIYISLTHGRARREILGHSHWRKVVSAPLGPSLHAFLSMSGEAGPHTSLTAVRRRCSRVGFPLGSHPWMFTIVRRRCGHGRVAGGTASTSGACLVAQEAAPENEMK